MTPFNLEENMYISLKKREIRADIDSCQLPKKVLNKKGFQSYC